MSQNSAYKWDVFFSYSTKDIDFARLIVQDLENQGLSIWFDRAEIRAGERIRERINEGISKSGSVIILISKHSLESRWVLNELDSAMLREINSRTPIVIPIVIGKIDLKKLPPDLEGKNRIDLRHNFRKKYQDARSELVTAIVSIVRAEFSGKFSDDEIFPIGPEGVGRILSIKNSEIIIGRLKDAYNSPMKYRIALDIFVDTYKDDGFWMENFKDSFYEGAMTFSRFIDEYGKLAAAEMLAFIIWHSPINQIHPMSENDFVELTNRLRLVLMMFDIQQKIQAYGLQIEMVAPKDEPETLAFRFSPSGPIINTDPETNL